MYYALFKVGFPDKEQVLSQTVKNLPATRETRVQSLGQEDLLEKGMATHFSILAWRISWTEEPGGLQSVGSQRVRHNWRTNAFTFSNMTTGYLRVGIMTFFFVQCCNMNSQPNIEQEIWMIACLNNRYIIVYPTELWMYTTGPCDLFVIFVID